MTSCMEVMDEIIFLGTGGGRNVMVSQLRYTGGIIMRIHGQQFHLDPGPGALIRALQFGINPMDTTAFLVSHSHLDHCNDINVMINLLTDEGREKKGVLVASSSITHKSSPICEPYLDWLEKVVTMKPLQSMRIGGVSIKALATKHNDKHAIGFRITTDKLTLTYTSDTDYSPKVVKSYEGSDIMMLNCLRPDLKGVEYHLSSDKVVKILGQIKPKLAILTHFGKTMLEATPIYESREIQRKTGVQTIAAHDGLILSPESYAVSSDQKRLGSF